VSGPSHAFTLARSIATSGPVTQNVLRFVLVASRIVRARLDEASARALSVLMREGRNESEAVRTALTEAAQRRARRSTLALEVARLADDQADAAERRAVMADMEAVAPDWPA